MRKQNFLFFTLIFLIEYSFGQEGSAAAFKRPNHVVLNEKAKHIDVDSSWLDKTGQQVQQVNFIENLYIP